MMTTQLVERLRAWNRDGDHLHGPDALSVEAADTIERLEAALREFVECARYDPHMDGSSTFMGWQQSALRRAETRARDTLNV